MIVVGGQYILLSSHVALRAEIGINVLTTLFMCSNKIQKLENQPDCQT